MRRILASVCPNQVFVANAVTKSFADPLQEFLKSRDTLDFSDQQPWAFIAIKAFDMNSSLRPLAKKLIKEKIVKLTDIIINAAALNFLEAIQIKKNAQKASNEINGILDNLTTKLSKKVELQYETVDELLDYNKTVFENCSTEQIFQLREYLQEKQLNELSYLIPEIAYLEQKAA